MTETLLAVKHRLAAWDGAAWVIAGALAVTAILAQPRPWGTSWTLLLVGWAAAVVVALLLPLLADQVRRPKGFAALVTVLGASGVAIGLATDGMDGVPFDGAGIALYSWGVLALGCAFVAALSWATPRRVQSVVATLVCVSGAIAYFELAFSGFHLALWAAWASLSVIGAGAGLWTSNRFQQTKGRGVFGS